MWLFNQTWRSKGWPSSYRLWGTPQTGERGTQISAPAGRKPVQIHTLYIAWQRLAGQATDTPLPVGDSACWFLPSRSTVGDARENQCIAEGQLKQEGSQDCKKFFSSANYLPSKSVKAAKKKKKITFNISTGKATLSVLQMPHWNYLVKIGFVIKIKHMQFQIHNMVFFTLN